MLRDGFGRGEVWLSGLGEFGIVVHRNASIVDEQMNPLGLFASQLLYQTLDFVFTGNVAWKGNDLAGTGIVLFHHLIQGLLATSGDVDLGTVGNQCLSDHEADSGSSASDYGRKGGYIEEFGGFEFLVRPS